MAKLKGIIFSVEDVVLSKNGFDKGVFEELTRFISFLKFKNIEFAVLTNRAWIVGDKPLEDAIKSKWGEFPYFCRAKDKSIPPKPKTDATKYVIDKMDWKQEETIFIGASDNDMRTARNGQLLFIRATWWANKIDYGFEFDSIKNIARFIDLFCLRDHWWSHEIKSGDLNYYSLAPFSTYKAEFERYSTDARAAAKKGAGSPDFWTSALMASVYFCGLHLVVDHYSVYPGHKVGSGNQIMDGALTVFGNCFKNYIPDLIVRHTESRKQQAARKAKEETSYKNQLNTIRLNETPRRDANRNYKSSPLKKDKIVMLFDDFTTKGQSMEAARAYIEQTGAKVILVSWLKTINTNYLEMETLGNFDPYKVNAFAEPSVAVQHSYHERMVDTKAPEELSRIFSDYNEWNWPSEID